MYAAVRRNAGRPMAPQRLRIIAHAPITWVDPPYNESNMLNGVAGGVALAINPQTYADRLAQYHRTIHSGHLRGGIPQRGELISTRRDFQCNVIKCQAAVTLPPGDPVRQPVRFLIIEAGRQRASFG